MTLTTFATAYGAVFLGELPDKTAVATLVLAARYRGSAVLAGVAAAFAVHVALAVLLGGLVAELPRRPLDLATGLLFVLGAVLLLRSDPWEAVSEGEENASRVRSGASPAAVAAGAFGVVLVAELGDLSQVLTATLTARFDDPVSVGAGALLALWSVATLAVVFGRSLLTRVPLRRVQRVAAAVLLVLAALSLLDAATG